MLSVIAIQLEDFEADEDLASSLEGQTVGAVALRTPTEVGDMDSDYIWFPGTKPVPQAAEVLARFLEYHPDHAFVRGAHPDGPGEFRPREFRKRPHQVGRSVLFRRESLGGRCPRNRIELATIAAAAIARGEKGAFLPAPLDEGGTVPELPDPELVFAELPGEPFRSSRGRPAHDRFQAAPLHFTPSDRTPDPNRLLFLLPHFAVGGSDKFNLDLAWLLKNDQGFEPGFIGTLSKEDGWRDRFEKISPDTFLLQELLSRPQFPRFIADYIESRNVGTVIVSHSTLGYQCLPWLRSRFPKTRFFDYLHIEEENWRSGGYPGLSLEHAPYLDATFVSSAHLRGWMEERGGNRSQIEVATTNIDPEDWNPAQHDVEAIRKEYGVEENERLILFAGRLSPQKQPLLLPAIVELLQKQEHSFRLLICGGGELREPLAEQLSGPATMLGELRPSAIQALMAAADIFFIPSEHEGIALANYEAMSMACAIVGSAVGGQAELVTTGCGILIPEEQKRSPEAYAEALADLISDPDRCREMGDRARERIRDHFRLSKMAAQIAYRIRQEKGATFETPPAPLLQRHLDDVIDHFRMEQELYRLNQSDDASTEERLRLEEELARLAQAEQAHLAELNPARQP